MIVEIAILIAGLYLILKGSEWITDAAIPLANNLNTTNVAVGLVLVSVLLSLPELLVAISSLTKGHTDISIGVIFGSIIVNLGLIIGVTAIIKPLKIPRHVVTRDAVFMVVATIVVTLIVLEPMQVTRRDGIVFLLLFIPYLINIYEQEKALAAKERKYESEMISKTLQFFGKIQGIEVTITNSWLMFLIGIVMLLLGAEFFTESLISIATIAGIPGILIGLTVGALGPSIANMAAAIQSVKRGYVELAVSETIGSNIFTLLITLGTLAIVQPFSIDAITANVTGPALLIITLTFFIMAFRGRVSRRSGILLVIMYLIAMIVEIKARIG